MRQVRRMWSRVTGAARSASAVSILCAGVVAGSGAAGSDDGAAASAVSASAARIDQLSNSTIDLIHAGNFDEAERICQRLLDEYPEVLDGHMRLGQLFHARGEPKKAADHLRLAAAIAFADDDASELGLSLAAEAASIDPTTP
jgi:lipopolysaccharide biosynthesis regulator YciM